MATARRILATAFMASAGLLPAFAGGHVARTTSLCELATLADLDSTLVSFKAIASTDLHHGVTLSDPACRNFGLRLGQESDSAEQTVGLFLHTLATQAPHWTWRSVSGTFIGVVQINPAGERRFIPSAVRDFKEVAYET